MIATCAAPDNTLGAALRMAEFLDCQGRVLGENGFQAIVGRSFGTGLFGSLMTIFVALIGYRLILGERPGLRDGIGWTARVGIILTLLTSWPAFQTLIYRVAVDGPTHIAGTLLTANRLPVANVTERVQSSYDALRLGITDIAVAIRKKAANGELVLEGYQFQDAMPKTASAFVIGTIGLTGAFKVAIGFLLAVGPFAILSLFFSTTFGLFSGWIRALVGAVLCLVASLLVSSLALVAVEGEIDRLKLMRGTSPELADHQAVITIVALFLLVATIANILALRLSGAFHLAAYRHAADADGYGPGGPERISGSPPRERTIPLRSDNAETNLRVSSINDALRSAMEREDRGRRQTASSNAHNRGSRADLSGERASAPSTRHAQPRLGRQSLGSRRRDRRT